MNTLQALVILQSSGDIVQIDAIKHEGGIWLVPNWLDNIIEKTTSPQRIIRMDTLQHQAVEPGSEHQFVVNTPIPEYMFDDQLPDNIDPQFEVVENPPLSFHNPFASSTN